MRPASDHLALAASFRCSVRFSYAAVISLRIAEYWAQFVSKTVLIAGFTATGSPSIQLCSSASMRAHRLAGVSIRIRGSASQFAAWIGMVGNQSDFMGV
jgi:hypothetical protein